MDGTVKRKTGTFINRHADHKNRDFSQLVIEKEILLVIQCFTGGIRKYIGSMKKSCIGRGEAEPNKTFFHGPNIFSYPPCKKLCNEFIPPKAFFFYFFYKLTDQISY